jgi:hypothetical protein
MPEVTAQDIQEILEGRAADINAILLGDLDISLEAYLRKHRGLGASYETIARDLSVLIPRAVSGTWVRRWAIRLGIDEGPE